MPRMVEEADDDLEEGGGLCITEQLEKMAREGDFEGVWQYLVTSAWGRIDQPECFRLLLQALEVAARKDPRRFSSTIFAKVIGFNSYLLLRSHFHIRALFDRHDAALRSQGKLQVPKEVAQILPDLIELQEHLAAMLETQARTVPMWGLVGKEAAENGNRSLPVFHAVLDFREFLPDVGAAVSDAATEGSAGVVGSVGEQGDCTTLGRPTRQAVPA